MYKIFNKISLHLAISKILVKLTIIEVYYGLDAHFPKTREKLATLSAAPSSHSTVPHIVK
jgi:hypothetical protein